MTGVQHLTVEAEEADQRLDRWLRRRFPHVTQGRIERMLRKGELRLDGARAKAADRLAPGQVVRVPPLPEPNEAELAAQAEPPPPSADDAEFVRSLVLYEDDHVIVLDKPAGLAVQGGTGQRRHLETMLGALAKPGKRAPRLAHRLDLETSGVLALGRTQPATAALAAAFRRRSTRKTYWAVTVGSPKPRQGSIRYALVKDTHGERMRCLTPEEAEADPEARQALTDYAVVESLGARCAWVALRPVTGRTHQLRAHLGALGCPIVGDGRYGDSPQLGGGFSRKLHLHARRLSLPHPADEGRILTVEAPLPEHMARTFAQLGWREDAPEALEPFADLEAELAARKSKRAGRKPGP